MKDEQHVLQRAQQFDEVALTEIYDTYAPAIYRYVYRKTGDGDTAQDLTAETFHRLLEALHRDNGPCEHLSGWLYRVAHNLIVDHYRRQPEVPHASLEHVHIAVPATQDQVIAQDGRVERARAALDQLTPVQQQVILLRFLEDLSLREVAEMLGRTVGSIKALQHRAINSLQRVLEEME